jgi:hypothetical protein
VFGTVETTAPLPLLGAASFFPMNWPMKNCIAAKTAIPWSADLTMGYWDQHVVFWKMRENLHSSHLLALARRLLVELDQTYWECLLFFLQLGDGFREKANVLVARTIGVLDILADSQS